MFLCGLAAQNPAGIGNVYDDSFYMSALPAALFCNVKIKDINPKKHHSERPGTFTLENHYHVRCVKCGEVSEVGMDEISDLPGRIHNTHGIEFLDYDILFKGICLKCREKVKEEKHG